MMGPPGMVGIERPGFRFGAGDRQMTGLGGLAQLFAQYTARQRESTQAPAQPQGLAALYAPQVPSAGQGQMYDAEMPGSRGQGPPMIGPDRFANLGRLAGYSGTAPAAAQRPAAPIYHLGPEDYRTRMWQREFDRSGGF